MVRKARIDEIDRINVLRKQVNDIHVEGRPDIFKPGFCKELQDHAIDMINSDWQDIFVCERNSEIAGIISVQYIHKNESPFNKEHSFLHIEEMIVDEQYRRQGVASELMNFAKEEANRRELPRVVLDVWSFNDEAVAFYESIGMKEFRKFMEI